MPKLCREVLWLALGRSDGKLAAGQTVDWHGGAECAPK